MKGNPDNQPIILINSSFCADRRCEHRLANGHLNGFAPIDLLKSRGVVLGVGINQNSDSTQELEVLQVLNYGVSRQACLIRSRGLCVRIKEVSPVSVTDKLRSQALLLASTDRPQKNNRTGDFRVHRRKGGKYFGGGR